MNLTFLDFIKPFADDIEPAILRVINEAGMSFRCTACVHGFPRQDRQRECLLKLDTERHKDCDGFEPFMRVALDEARRVIGGRWVDLAAYVAFHFEGMSDRHPMNAIERWRRGKSVPGWFYKAAVASALTRIFADILRRKKAVLDDMDALRKIG